MSMPLEMPRAETALPPGIGAWVVDALRRHPAPRDERDLCVVTVPAPRAPVESLLELIADGDGFVWSPPEGPAEAGVGVAFGVRAGGRERFEHIVEAAGAAWPRVSELAHPETSAPPPRMYGGFAFAPGAASGEPWVGFGDADVALPRWCYGTDGERAWLRVVVTDWDQAAVRASTASSIATLCATLAARGRRGVPRDVPRPIDVAEDDPAIWHRQVEAIRRAIVRQRCEKVVAARSCTLTLEAEVEPAAVLGRLGDSYPGCFRFAFRRGDASFVGATPERLIRRVGDRVDSEALAGTAAVGDAGALLASAKDRGEQAPVVHAIRDTLSPMCRELEVPDEPEVRALPGVLHLSTRIRGRLAQPAHVLDLVRALHPTPAVGGFPAVEALAWIAEHEPEGRGWYAAPVGWFDACGDGEWAVAIRSGVLRRNRAYLFAGAGIVRDSDPAAELAETRLKLRALESALGVTG